MNLYIKTLVLSSVFLVSLAFASDTSTIKKHQLRIQLKEEYYSKITNEVHREGFPFVSIVNSENFDFGQGNISTRGNYSVHYPKKSFRIDLDHKGPYFGKDLVRTIFLISMAEDPYLMNNYYAYTLATKVGLFFSRFHYVELFINNKPQGIYLAVEPPEESLKRRFPEAIGILRREANKEFDIKFRNPRFNAVLLSAFAKEMSLLPSKSSNFQVNKNSLEKLINTDAYFKYLAFQRLLMNGDYSRDEIYLTMMNSNNRIRIEHFSVWDCDDLFQGPWNGTGILYRNGTMSLVYEGTSPLDVWIAFNAPMYRRYLSELSKLSADLDEDTVSTVVEKTYKDLEVYLTKKEKAEFRKQADLLKTKTEQSRIDIQDNIRKYLKNAK